MARSCLGGFGLDLDGEGTANLGDGRGSANQTGIMRDDYGYPLLGSCIETLLGGNHFRYFVQMGSGAYFLAASVEKNLTAGHDIVENG